MMLNFLPLAVAAALACVPALAAVSPRVDRVLTRAALGTFGRYVREGDDRADRRGRLHAAHVDSTYVAYASRTLLFAALAGVVGAILGIYAVWGGFLLLGVPPETVRDSLPTQLWFLADLLSVPDLSAWELFVVFLGSNATLGLTAALGTYHARWWWPAYRAGERARRVDASMERTVAFTFALARSGMPVPAVLSAVAKHRDVYGEAAEELSVAVADIELFGTDMLRAIRRAGRRTPSDDFEEFAENLASVLQSGRSVSAFLREQYEYYKEESAAKQARFLELLATLAEAYVTVLVAGPLFLITILAVVGLVMGGMLPVLRLFTYLVVPLLTFGFVVYLDSLTESPTVSRTEVDVAADRGAFAGVRSADAAATTGRPDGGTERAVGRAGSARVDAGPAGDGSTTAKNAARLRAYDRFRGIRERLFDPVETVVDRPLTLFYVTVPLAVAFVAWRCWSLLGAGGLTVRTVDDVVVQATLFLVGTYAGAYEARRRRVRRVEAAMPDFLDRLASVNEAGMPVAASVRRVARSDLGGLNDELDRVVADVEWGARVERAFQRFERRMRAPTVTRVVSLVTNAMRASGDLGPVLRIAADQAQTARRLERERRQELLTYVVVIYLSFFVFLVIVAALTVFFVPSLPTAEQLEGLAGPGGGMPGNLGSLTEADKDAYRLLFFHTALVQGACSGVVAGQMGENDFRAGAKHAAAMLAVAYVVGLVLF